MKSPIQLFIAAAILLATATVAAQVYKWVDKDGKVQYGDSPPPAGATKTEAKKIDTAPVAATAPPAAKSLQDRAKESDKLKAEEAEKAKKADVAQQNAAISASNCSDARGSLRDLESGRPIARTTEAGAREYLDDAARQAEIAKARKAVAEFCKG
jgi:hypothetical protein